MQNPKLGVVELQSFMRAHGIPGEILHLSVPTPTVESAAQALGTQVDQIIKSILFVVDEQPVLAVACGLTAINSRAIADLFKLGRKRVKLASAEAVLEISGYEVGAMPPFGHRQPLTTLIDRKVLGFTEAYAGGGAENALVRLNPQDILRVSGAKVLDLQAQPMGKNLRRSRTKTSTSKFGSPGHLSHDSTPFYASRLYQDQPLENLTDDSANPVPADCLDRIFQGSSENMAQLPDNSIHLMVTSPPYNVGKEYDADLTLPEYLAFLEKVWREVFRLLIPGGRACINVANLGRKPYLPLHAWIAESMLQLGYLMRGEIIWNKAASASPSTAWGSWKSATNPTLRDVHEYILVFSKGAFKRQSAEPLESTISKEEFLEFTRSVWSFPAEAASRVGHPAPFPLALPYRLIQLYSFKGEVVLDPFMGSGQTALAALNSSRHYIGYEINPEYVDLANTRIHEASAFD